jgi:septal ring-binding cell division protein DamX
VQKTENKKPLVRYILVYGIFESYLEAKNVSEKLPETIKAFSPWIRQFGVLQSIVNIKQEKTKT